MPARVIPGHTAELERELIPAGDRVWLLRGWELRADPAGWWTALPPSDRCPPLHGPSRAALALQVVRWCDLLSPLAESWRWLGPMGHDHPTAGRRHPYRPRRSRKKAGAVEAIEVVELPAAEPLGEVIETITAEVVEPEGSGPQGPESPEAITVEIVLEPIDDGPVHPALRAIWERQQAAQLAAIA